MPKKQKQLIDVRRTEHPETSERPNASGGLTPQDHRRPANNSVRRGIWQELIIIIIIIINMFGAIFVSMSVLHDDDVLSDSDDL